MATTTSNFGWAIPQSTDLVKDGATAIAALGNGVDTSMAQLKGGTTGQILSKTSNTDMAFTWTTPNPGDITGVTAGTGLTGGGTSGDVTVSFDVANYGGGQGAAGKNANLNSNFSVWQRGTSFTNCSSVYTADRWFSYTGGVTTGRTISRQATGDTTNLPNIQYCARISRDNGNTNTSAWQFAQFFETVNSIPFAGKTFTFSFYARKGANFSAASSNLLIYVSSGTGTDQTTIAGYTGGVDVIAGSTATLTTTWQRFTFTGTFNSNITELTTNFYWTPVGTAGAADYFEVTGVQLELGSTATPYKPNGATQQAELAACQRYYYRQTVATNFGNLHGTGVEVSGTSGWLSHFPPITMRVKPSSVDYSNIKISNASVSFAVTALSLNANNSDGSYFITDWTSASGGTANRPCILQANNNSAAYIGFSAEL